MGIDRYLPGFDWVMGRLGYSKSGPSRSTPSSGSVLFGGASSVQGSFGQHWTESRYETVKHFRHWVYVAVSRIVDLVASKQPTLSVSYGAVGDADVPAALVGKSAAEVRDYFQRHRIPLQERNKSVVPFSASEEMIPAPFDHPLNDLLRNPNPEDTPLDFWSETLIHLLLSGSAYWWKNRNGLGLPCELWTIPSQWVWPKLNKNGHVESYIIRPYDGNYAGTVIPAADVVCFKRKSPLSRIDGYSPLTAGSVWIDGVESIDKSRFYTFKNGVQTQYAVEFDSTIQMNDDRLERLQARIDSRYVGEDRAGRPFLTPPGAKIRPLILSPRDMDFGAGFEQLRDSTLALYGVSPIIAGIVKDLTYGAIISAQMGFCTFTANPLLAMLSQSTTKHLAAEFDPRLRVWWHKVALDDPQQDEKALLTDIMAGAITVDEIRAIRGRNPWGGEYALPIRPSNQAGSGHTQIQGAGGGQHNEGGDKQ